ncbi:MAG TPA: hypothetical protein VGH55_05840, partial [Chthoniobacterales bacterium]
SEPGVGRGKLLGVFLFPSTRIGHLVRQVQALSVCRVPCPARPCCFNCYTGQPSKADFTGNWLHFGASPYHKNVEDQDDDEYEDDEPSPPSVPNNAKS